MVSTGRVRSYCSCLKAALSLRFVAGQDLDPQPRLIAVLAGQEGDAVDRNPHVQGDRETAFWPALDLTGAQGDRQWIGHQIEIEGALQTFDHPLIEAFVAVAGPMADAQPLTPLPCRPSP